MKVKRKRREETVFDFPVPSSDYLTSLLPFKFVPTFLDGLASPSLAPHSLLPRSFAD